MEFFGSPPSQISLKWFYLQMLWRSIPSGLRSTAVEDWGLRETLTSPATSSILKGERRLEQSEMYWIRCFRPSAVLFTEPASLRDLDQDLFLTENVRSIRNNEVEPSSHSYYRGFSSKGLLPHQKRKSYPYYGRKRRSSGVVSGWTILDPVTGRQILE